MKTVKLKSVDKNEKHYIETLEVDEIAYICLERNNLILHTKDQEKEWLRKSNNLTKTLNYI